jgi:hypothetical protein
MAAFPNLEAFDPIAKTKKLVNDGYLMREGLLTTKTTKSTTVKSKSQITSYFKQLNLIKKKTKLNRIEFLNELQCLPERI